MIHAELGASGADRWMNCPGSIRMERPFPNVGTEYTREGTCAHEVAERCLKGDIEPETFLGVELEGVEVTEDMCEAVAVYLKIARQLLEGCDRLWIEQQFDLASLNPPAPMFGTADCVVLRGDVLHVLDYKHGRGYAVAALGNPQLRYYALGAIMKMSPELARHIRKVVVTIIQPRAAHPDGIVRSDELTIGELHAFSEELIERAELTLHEDAPLTPGGWCGFCRAQAVCPAKYEQAVAVAQTEFVTMVEPTPPAPAALTMPEILAILPKLPLLESWIRSLREFVQTRLEEGTEVPGWKLVEKRAQRKWRSEEQVAAWSREQMGLTDDEIFDKKLKSPAQLEKVVGKKNLPDELIIKESSGYNVAPDYDSRPPVNVTRGEEFSLLPPPQVDFSEPTKAATTRRTK